MNNKDFAYSRNSKGTDETSAPAWGTVAMVVSVLVGYVFGVKMG